MSLLKERKQPSQTLCNCCYCICCNHIIPQRYVMTAFMIIGPTVAYMHRVGINLAIVAMTLPRIVHHNGSEEVCPPAFPAPGTITEVKLNDQQFNWDETTQSYILLSFYVGYMAGNALAGYLSDTYGARWFVMGGMFLSSIMTGIVPPLADNLHWSLIVLSRVLCGFGQCALFPGASSLVSRWIPDENKSSVYALIMSSFTLGILLGNVLTGYIIKWTHTWCWVFYIYGILGIVWSTAFYFFVHSAPQTHPRISDRELEKLATIRTSAVENRGPTPWKALFRDLSVWSVVIAQFGNDFTLFTVVTNMPKYFAEMLNINTEMTGTILMLPPVACFVGSLFFGQIADVVIRKKLMKVVYFRILASFVAMPVACVCMIFMTMFKCHLILANSFLCLAMFAKAAFFVGVGIMALDISNNCAGFIFGMGTASGSLAGTIAPYTIAKVVYNNTFQQWLIVQYLSLTICLVMLIPYLCFAKGGRKKWDYLLDEKIPEDLQTDSKYRHLLCYKPE